ncbi:MAG: hypothetical protein IPN95_04985 [Bacteroidetes bacterium]|nr:hypothetical protein [Bacteroidota bacterium]
MVTLGKGGLFAQSYEVCHGCHLRFEGGGMMAFGFKTKVFTGSNFLPKIGIAAEITLDDTREGFLLGRGSIFRYHDKYYRVVAISRENPNGEDRGNMEFVQMSQLFRFARVVNGRKAH